MAGSTIRGAAVKGIAAAVPEQTAGVAELAAVFGPDEASRIARSVGVTTRRLARPGQCTSDFCFAAAQALLQQLDWDPATVEGLIFVSQTPDHRLPATSCGLQHRLGLPKSCAALDLSLGCSGYVYGLWLASSLALTTCKRMLLLAGDTTQFISPLDRATMPVFGAAGTATALESDPEGAAHFELGTDGAGYEHLIIPAGGCRAPHSPQTAERTEREGGNIRSQEDLYLNGAEVFTFTLREVPSLISRVLARSGWAQPEIDAFVLHQANKFMLDHLVKRMKIDPAKAPIALDPFGNTSSASIPLTLVHLMRQRLQAARQRLVLAGFGVGFSWGAAALDAGPIVVPELQIVP